MSGIYAFWDDEKGYYAYIGRFTHRDRITAHYYPSKYDEQQFNCVLQNNPDRYEYRILMEGDYNDEQLNKMEKFCIKHLKTYRYDYPGRSVFNFTKGGGGISGNERSDETKKKISEGRQGIIFSDEHRKNLSESHKGKEPWNKGVPMSDEQKHKLSESHTGKTLSDEHKQKISKSNTRNYPRIVKNGFQNGKQQYCIKYNKKVLKISQSVKKLEDWFKENYPNEELIKGG